MISFFRVLSLLLFLCAITGCVSTKVYKRDIKDVEAILWSYHNRLLDVELEQIKRILEDRIKQFHKNLEENYENNEND